MSNVDSEIDEILQLIVDYESVVRTAESKGFLKTKNFVGDIIEELVCKKIGASRDDVESSTRGYDAKKGEERIQIKFRSPKKSGDYKITFKNCRKTDLGFEILAFCKRTEKGFCIYEIDSSKLVAIAQEEAKRKRVVVVLSNQYLDANCLRKSEVLLPFHVSP